MRWYWHTFSFEGLNQGVCIVAAETKALALQKIIDLGIHPLHDNLVVFVADDLAVVQGEGMELDRLYSRRELLALGYISVRN